MKNRVNKMQKKVEVLKKKINQSHPVLNTILARLKGTHVMYH